LTDIPAYILTQAKSRELQPSVRIGKAGLTETVVEEINAQLNKRGLVKIKANKGLFERNQRSEVWSYLSEATTSVVVLKRGNIGVLWRR